MISAQNYILLNLQLKKYLLEIRASNFIADFIIWKFSTYYSNYVLTFKGFPQLQIAMISGMGVIKAFPIDGQPYETFPEFKPKKFDDFRMDTSLHL